MSFAGMSNVLEQTKQQQVLALGRWAGRCRRIEQATGVRRETVSGYLRAAGHPGARPWAAERSGRQNRQFRRRCPPTPPAKTGHFLPEVSTDSSRPARAPSASACEPYRELIAEALGRGRNAMAIWQDLVDDHGFTARYASVRRFVRTLRGDVTPPRRAS